MRKFKFIGTKLEADEYGVETPIYNNVYTEEYINKVWGFSTLILAKKEWEEVKQNQNVTQPEHDRKEIALRMFEVLVNKNNGHDSISDLIERSINSADYF